MSEPITTDHKGVSYKSQKEMCDAYEVAESLFCKRHKRGWTLQECLEGKKPFYSRDGKDFYTQKEICDTYNIHPNTMRKKLSQGYTIDEIIDRKTFRVSDHMDKKYESTEVMCQIYGVKKSTFRARKRNGMSTQEALEKPIKN